LKGFVFHEKQEHGTLVTCVNPPINYDLFNEVFTFVVAGKERTWSVILNKFDKILNKKYIHVKKTLFLTFKIDKLKNIV
jgi:hypothetical protein